MGKILGKYTYRQYLKSEEWRETKKRLSPGKMCFICGIDGRLNLHHTTYLTMGHESGDDLIWLCKPHHKKVHNLVKNSGVSLKTAHLVLLDIIGSSNNKIKRKNLRVGTKHKKKKRVLKIRKYHKNDIRSILLTKDVIRKDAKEGRAKAAILRLARLELWGINNKQKQK